MSYLNPLYAFGFDKLAERALETGVSGFIVPDLPYEESGPLKDALDAKGLALVQLVTPATPLETAREALQRQRGFRLCRNAYRHHGRQRRLPDDVSDYLAAVKSASSLPVCAGFGVREQAQVRQIAEHADGVIVGSALLEALEAGKSPREFLESLRP